LSTTASVSARASTSTSTSTSFSRHGSSPFNAENKWKIGDKCQATVEGKWVNVVVDDASIKGNWFSVFPETPGAESFFALYSSLRHIPKIFKNWKVGQECLGLAPLSVYFLLYGKTDSRPCFLRESAMDGKSRSGIVVKVFSSSCMVTFPEIARVETLVFEKLTPVDGEGEEEAKAATAVRPTNGHHAHRDDDDEADNDETPSGPRGLSLEMSTPSTPSLQGIDRRIILGSATEKLKTVDLAGVSPFNPKRK